MRLAIAAFLLCAATAGCGGSTSSTLLTAPASPAIVPSATTVSFGSSTSPQTLTVSEPGYGGTFSAVTSNSAVAKVTESSSSTAAHERVVEATTTATFVITPVGGGTATITITDTLGHSVTVTVTVTGASLVPQTTS